MFLSECRRDRPDHVPNLCKPMDGTNRFLTTSRSTSAGHLAEFVLDRGQRSIDLDRCITAAFARSLRNRVLQDVTGQDRDDAFMGTDETAPDRVARASDRRRAGRLAANASGTDTGLRVDN